MTDNLTWLLTKNSSCFIVRRNGVEFAKEKFNLANRNCRKYSGLAAVKGCDLSLSNKKITLSTKVAKRSNKPAQSCVAAPLNKCTQAASKALDSQLSSNHYRSDLKKVAMAKWCLLNRVAQVEKGSKKKTICKTRGVQA